MGPPGLPTSSSRTQTIIPTVSTGGIITNSTLDKNITDTIARMQRYLDDEDSFAAISATVRKDIVRGLKSSFGNRYNGRCTVNEKTEFIARWVELANFHNDQLTSIGELKSLGIKIDPKLLK